MNGIRDELAAEGIRSCGGEEDSGLFDNEPVEDDKEVSHACYCTCHIYE